MSISAAVEKSIVGAQPPPAAVKDVEQDEKCNDKVQSEERHTSRKATCVPAGYFWLQSTLSLTGEGVSWEESASLF